MEVEGRKIIKVREMTQPELNAEYWDNGMSDPVVVLELDDGSKLFPSRDYEGNGGGALFGTDKENNAFTLLGRPVVDTSKMNNDEFGKYLRETTK